MLEQYDRMLSYDHEYMNFTGIVSIARRPISDGKRQTVTYLSLTRQMADNIASAVAAPDVNPTRSIHVPAVTF